MRRVRPRPLVHLELHTGDAPRAGAFYAELLQWRAERVASYLTCLLYTSPSPRD